MKNIKFITYFFVTTLIFGFTSCSDMLEETPRSVLTPDYFRTGQGVKAGVVAAYSGLRYLYGPDGALCFTIPGTDEFFCTDMMNGTQGAMDDYSANYSSSNGSLTAPWNVSFQFINTCNGVIEYGTEAEDLTDTEKTQIFAEARFLRAFYYYIITMNYGGAPLDLGSGELKFNITPSTTSIRNSRADIFETIIADLIYAKDNLPNTPSEPGRAAKSTALHFLAKVYLSRASLESAVSTDYQSAYDTAMELINNKETYGTDLTEDYSLIHLEGNENEPEILFNVQRTWTASGPNHAFEESNDVGGVENKGNRANFFFTAGYENVQTPTGTAIVPRSMEYQRPWRMFVPSEWLVMEAFNDKENDARWDGSYRMEWMAGVDVTIDGREIKTGELGVKITLDRDNTGLIDAGDSMYKDQEGVENGAIYKPYVLYYWGMLYNADGSYRNGSVQYVYPNLKKYDDTKRSALNYDSNRPYILARLAETYLIAAEAAMYNGNTPEAARLINIVRTRAAYRAELSATELANRIAAMQISASDVNIDFILAERSREMCGESWRWIDLARTGKLVERVRQYNPLGKSNIQDYHVLRPLPQDQIDLLSDPAQKATYQNPGY